MPRRLLLAVALWLSSACLAAEVPPLPPVVWKVTAGCDRPKCVCFDAKTGSIFVSQIGGAPEERDGVGWISRLDRDGKVLAAKWVSGLNAPKGLRAHDKTLWVSDIDEIVAIDISTAKVVSRVHVDDKASLHDLAVDGEGTVYSGDMMANRIFKVRDRKASVFAEGPHLDFPNGLLVEGDALLVGGRGELTEKLQVIRPGRLFRLNLNTAKQQMIVEEPLGDLDGIEPDGSGGYIVTDWLGGRVFHITRKKEVKTLFQLDLGTSRHVYFPDRRVLVVPHLLRNTVTAYDLTNFVE